MHLAVSTIVMWRVTWRLLRVFGVTLAHSLHLLATIGRRPTAERNRYRAHKQQAGCRAICRILGIEVRVEGQAPDRRGMLAVCNHLGLLDTVVLASVLPVAFVSKAEVRNWPFVGWVTRLVGALYVDRERPMQAGELVDHIRDRLADGVSVLVFPEGTTSDGRGVRPFKTGAFAAIASQPDTFVLPLCLRGEAVDEATAPDEVRRVLTWSPGTTMSAHARQLLRCTRIVITLAVGTPIAAEGADRKTLARLSQEAVEVLAGWKRSTGGQPDEFGTQAAPAGGAG